MSITPSTNQADVREEIKGVLTARLRLTPGSLDEHASLEKVGLNSLLLTETVTDIEDRYDVALDVASLAEHLSPLASLSVLLDELSLLVPAAR